MEDKNQKSVQNIDLDYTKRLLLYGFLITSVVIFGIMIAFYVIHHV